ncbi:MAG: type 1 glutamine amidotransferase domain-containing protein [Actinomycetota bacterium]|nr:type 1 glutamine amidotransferase domain-containing protein [Actinomycetota bacterium]
MILTLLPSTGFDPTEAAVPWRALVEAGIEVRFATPDGRVAAADERLVTGGFSVLDPVLMTKSDSLEAYRAMAASPEFRAPMSYAEVALGPDDGLLLPGGHDKGVKTLLESEAAQAIAADAMTRGLPVGAICHGVVLLARAIDPATGKSVLHGRRTTALTKSLELSGWQLTRLRLGDYYRTYPQTVQDEVVSALASSSDFDAGPLLARRDSARHTDRGFTVRDGNYLSARWPGDAHTFAHRFVALVNSA